MTLHTERDGNVVTLRIDNPGRRGSLDIETAAAMRAACAELREDRSARVIVVTGTQGSFCSGADLGAVRDAVSGVLARRELLLRYYGAFLDVRDLPQPTIAAVGGPAVGAGLNLALACDIRVAARESARFGATISIGLATLDTVDDNAATILKRADQALYRAKRDGRNRVVADAALAAEVASLAASMALGAPQVVRMTKRALRLAQDAEFATILDLEALAQAASQEADDAGEGWAAFRERRPPRFEDA